MQPVGVVLGVLDALTAQREWLERLAIVIPGVTATRWLLVGDVACLVAVGLGTRRSTAGIALAIAIGFVALNALGLALLDFYLALAAFHLVVAVTTVLFSRRGRWLGVVLLVVALTLGVVT